MKIQQSLLKKVIFAVSMLVYLPWVNNFYIQRGIYTGFGNRPIANSVFTLFALTVIALCYFASVKLAKKFSEKYSK